MSELLRYCFEKKYVIFDVETNGLNLTETLPWQISWITAKGKFVTSEHDHLPYWEGYDMKPEIAAINHFNYSEYKSKGEDPLSVLQNLLSYILNPEYIVVGQNILGFDVYVLNTMMKKLGLKPDYSYIPRCLDTRAIQMAIGTGQKTLDRNDPLKQYTFLNHRDKKIKASQGAMLKEYNIPHDPALLHGAIYDVKMTFEILKKQIQTIEI
jgi:DNA polymerase III epsilon subunit-like protein